MARYIINRIGLALVTLWLLATIVFFIVTVIPGDVGRQILGPFAPQETVDAFNEEIGANDPMLTQYLRTLKSTVTFDYGDSYATKIPVMTLVKPTLLNSAKLAAMALLFTIPVSLMGGIIAARRRDTAVDRGIVLLGLATSSIPEFVTGTVLSLTVGLGLGLLPTLSIWPDGTSLWGQLKYIVLPALSMAIVYFGYIARMMRAGTISALESDYTRTAVMKGLPAREVMTKHVFRNAVAPTISVIGVQIGYLFGGLVGVEKIFNYNGLGRLILTAVGNKDIPVLQASVLIIGIIYMVATLLADLTIAWLNPRLRSELGQ